MKKIKTFPFYKYGTVLSYSCVCIQGMPLHDGSSESALGMKMESTGQKMSKSSSMSSIQNDSTVSERTIVNQDDINILTQGVKSFSDGLARLKTVFGECTGKLSYHA